MHEKVVYSSLGVRESVKNRVMAVCKEHALTHSDLIDALIGLLEDGTITISSKKVTFDVKKPLPK